MLRIVSILIPNKETRCLHRTPRLQPSKDSGRSHVALRGTVCPNADSKWTLEILNAFWNFALPNHADEANKKISNYGHWVYFIGCQWDWRRVVGRFNKISWQTREATRWYCSGFRLVWPATGWEHQFFSHHFGKHGRSSARMVWRYFTFFPIPASWQEQYTILISDGGGGKVSNSKKNDLATCGFPLFLLLGGCGEKCPKQKHIFWTCWKMDFIELVPTSRGSWLYRALITSRFDYSKFESQMVVAGPWSMVAGWHITFACNTDTVPRVIFFFRPRTCNYQENTRGFWLF